MEVSVRDICQIMENLAPLALKEKWDNIGLLIGDYEQEVKMILTALELTDEVIDEAIAKKIDLIITHHPLIFKPMKSLTADNPKADKIMRLIKNNISYYAAHTNFDFAFGGMGDLVAEKIGLKSIKPLAVEERAGRECALARIGSLDEELSASELAKKLASIYQRDINYYDSGKIIEKVAVIGGAGMDFADIIATSEADAFVTGDIKYHEVMESKHFGLSIFDVGHFDSEIIFATKVAEFLRRQLKNNNFKATVIVSSVEKSPFKQARYEVI